MCKIMKFLITGVSGQVGSELSALLGYGENVLALRSVDFDISDKEAVNHTIGAFCPDIIFHCAAYTAVDKAESERERCFAINADGTRYIAKMASTIGATLLYISTDYVFDGTKEGLCETDSLTNPLSVYGKSKLVGEEAVCEWVDKHFIVRTSWVFGNGYNFVRTILRLGYERGEVNVVSDQIGSPTYAADLAQLLIDMAQTRKFGIYHATNEGFCSWYEFACEIFKIAGLDVKVNPINTTEFNAAAPRPRVSRLSKDSLTNAKFERLPKWQDALARYLELIT